MATIEIKNGWTKTDYTGDNQLNGLYTLVPHGSKTYDPDKQRVVEEAVVEQLPECILRVLSHYRTEPVSVIYDKICTVLDSANLGRKEQA